MSRRVLMWALVSLVVVRLIVLIALCAHPEVAAGRGNLPGDIKRFHAIAIDKGVPYRDREVEYPLLTYGVIRVLAVGGIPTSSRVVAVFSFLCDIAVAGALAYGWSKRAALVYLVAGLAYLVYPIIYLRLDLLSIALALWGLAWVRRHRNVRGGILIGAAVFTKLWPGNLIPISWVAHRTRAAYVSAATAVAGVIVWALIGGVAGPMQVVTFRGARGWQIESVGGALVRALVPSNVHAESGALRIGLVPPLVKTGLTALMLCSLLAVVWFVWQGMRGRDDADAQPGIVDAVAPIAMIMAMLVFSPLFSPQYGVWLLPFGAIAWWANEREIAGWTFAVTTGSAILLARIIELKNGSPFEVSVVLVRNGCAVILLGFAITRVVSWSRQRRRTVRPATAEALASVDPPASGLTAGVGQN